MAKAYCPNCNEYREKGFMTDLCPKCNTKMLDVAPANVVEMVYLCSKCKKLFSQTLYTNHICEECGDKLISLNVSADEWDGMSGEQHKNVYEKAINSIQNTAVESEQNTLDNPAVNEEIIILREIAADISKIKGIMNHFFVNAIIAACIGLLVLMAQGC